MPDSQIPVTHPIKPQSSVSPLPSESFSFDSVPAVNPGLAVKVVIPVVAGLVLLAGIVSLLWFGRISPVSLSGTAPRVLPSSRFCRITLGNLCEGEIVQLSGYVDNSGLVTGVGYPFRVENLSVANPVYLQNLIFTGTRLGGFENTGEIPHQIPFGSRIVVRGRVVIQDRGRCTDPDYARKYPAVCTPDGFRLKIAPDAIFALTESSSTAGSFSIFGKIADLDQAKTTCPTGVMICEGDSNDSCHQIVADQLLCPALNTDPNMFLLTGYYRQTADKTLAPFASYHVRGISYTNQPETQLSRDISSVINTAATRKPAGVVAVYSATGEILTRFDTGRPQYYDLSLVHPGSGSVYYFVGHQLYQKEYAASDPVLVGTLDQAAFPAAGNLYNFFRSSDGRQLLFTTIDRLSEKVINQHSVSTDKFTVHRLDLTNPKITDGIVQTSAIYSEVVEGFMSLEGYNQQNQLLLLSKTFSADAPLACRRREYYTVDLASKTPKEVVTVTDSGNKYCGGTITEKLYVSPAGDYLVLADDFNPVLPAPRPGRISVYTITKTGHQVQTILAERSLIDDRSVKILAVDPAQITLIRPRSPDILYTFDRSAGSSAANLQPDKFLVPAREQAGPGDPTPGPYHKLYSLPSAEFIHTDADNWYFFNRQGAEKQLYVVNKQTKEVFLAAAFSVSAQVRIVAGRLYIVD